MPDLRKAMRKLQGWIICQAKVVQVGCETWLVKEKLVFYIPDNGSLPEQE
jgi:hypothetical protein